MSNYVLVNKITGLYLSEGYFMGKDKNVATRLNETEAKKLKDAFNTLTKRLNIEMEKA